MSGVESVTFQNETNSQSSAPAMKTNISSNTVEEGGVATTHTSNDVCVVASRGNMRPGTGKKLPGDNNSGCETGSDTGNKLPSVSWADIVRDEIKERDKRESFCPLFLRNLS
jgi:hypothetical protein